MKIVGLTGGIACGKSTVAKLMLARNVPVVDADLLAREVVAPGEPALDQIVAAFGEAIVNADGSLDRPALGRLIFSDDKARQDLEGITHPAIARRSQQRFVEIAAKGHQMAVYEAALLVETGGYQRMAALVVVSAPASLQIERLLARDSDLSTKDAKQRIQSQMPIKEKEQYADFVIHNDGSLEKLAKVVDGVLTKLRKLIDG